MTGAPPKVFISYSHDTVEHQERVKTLADRLRADGVDAEIDQYNVSPPEGWPLWCERQIAAADIVLMICTETYHRRVSGHEKGGTGLGVVWEARIIRQFLYDAGAVGDKFVPVLFSNASPEQIPTPIKGGTRYVVDTEKGYEDLYRRLTGQPSVVKPRLGSMRSLPIRGRQWPEEEMEAVAFAAAKAPGSSGGDWGVRRVVEDTLSQEPGAAPGVAEGPQRPLIDTATAADLEKFQDIHESWCPVMVVLPAGWFLMGSRADDPLAWPDEGPQQEITFGRRLAIGAWPVTFNEYDEYCYAQGYSVTDDAGWGRKQRPLINVSWHEAIAYTRWLSSQTSARYRLPSEAEWEYAARAGQRDILRGDSGGALQRTFEVGQTKANSWNLLDMQGNVWQWTADAWHPGHVGAAADGSPRPGGGPRVVRGGSWQSLPRQRHPAARLPCPQELKSRVVGFRVAREI